MDTSPLGIERSSTLNLLNWVGSILRTIGVNFFRMDADAMLRRAESETKFALSDPTAIEGLRQLLDSVNAEARLNTFGRIALSRTLQRSLVQRMLVEHTLQENPEILASPVTSPVFIIGMPRTGTTILHALLHQDERHRSPLCWECLIPHPAPNSVGEVPGLRIDAVRKEFDQIFKLVPDFKKKHYMEADSPQECIGITALNFTSFQYTAQCYLPSYLDWFSNNLDQSINFRWHKRFLQFLQSGDDQVNRWLLKSPVHLLRLKSLFQVYPDAIVVMLHRDPTNIVPSCASLITSVRSLYSDHEDPVRTGQEQLKIWASYFDRFLEDRRELDKESQIIDLTFDEFVRDQMRVVEKIYSRFGWELDSKTRTNMSNFLHQEQKDKHGKHEYSLEQFGIAQGDIQSQYVNYLEFLENLNASQDGVAV